MGYTRNHWMQEIGESPSGEPVWLIVGGAGDGDTDADDGDDTEEDDDDPDDDDIEDDDIDDSSKNKPPAKRQPAKKAAPRKSAKGKEGDTEDPEDNDADSDADTGRTKADVARIRATLRKERTANRQMAKKLRDMEAEKAASENDKEHIKLRNTIRDEVESEYKPVVVKVAAKAAFLAAGVPDEYITDSRRFNKLFKLLDQDDVDVDAASGEVSGLEDAVLDLKDEFPQFFRKRRKAAEDDGDGEGDTDSDAPPKRRVNGRRAGSVSTGTRRPAQKDQNMTEKMMDAARRYDRGGGFAGSKLV